MSCLELRLLQKLRDREDRAIMRRLPPPVAENSTQHADFYTNDYLSLRHDSRLRERFLQRISQAENIGGSGGSRLLVNPTEHVQLESRLCSFFNAPSALLFNSGFDANVGLFSCLPGEDDVVIYDEYIHASVHDGMRSSRAKDALFSFRHNSTDSFKGIMKQLCRERPCLLDGKASVFIAVEALYSMDGDLAPLRELVDLVETMLPHGNGHIVVDEAHSTGIYGDEGRGLVAMLGLEDRVTARLHTFGKALASSGGE